MNKKKFNEYYYNIFRNQKRPDTGFSTNEATYIWRVILKSMLVSAQHPEIENIANLDQLVDIYCEDYAINNPKVMEFIDSDGLLTEAKTSVKDEDWREEIVDHGMSHVWGRMIHNRTIEQKLDGMLKDLP